MRTPSSLPLLLLALAALVPAGRGRTLQDPVDVDVDGHSPTQLDATRYEVGDEEAAAAAEAVTAPDVSLPGLGSLSGTVTLSDQKRRPIYSYLGVPFAEPPVGDLRFVAPVPKKPWTGVRDASTPGNICMQVDASSLLGLRARRPRASAAQTQSEDCLVLDVHTPQVNSSAKLPVLVFVHGGSFLTGWAGEKNPQGLLDHDMVLVSPQYRLGPLGFLNLQTEGVPGNAGLLDIVEALRWVRDNIEHFGGDPSRVTLGGHSAGAAVTSLLYLSPLTKDLVQAAMPMSGSALAFWAWDRKPEQAASDITQAALCGGPGQALDARVQCLKKLPAKRLISSYILFILKAMQGGHLIMSGSCPSVQQAGVVVLPDLPENVLSSPDFTARPYLTGITKHEGTFPLEVAEQYYFGPSKLTNNATYLRNDLIHVVLQIIGLDDPASYVADASLQAFMDLSTLGDFAAMRDGVIDLVGAFGFKSPARRIAQLVSDHGQPSSYLYAFNHNGALTQNSPQGVSHGADQPYIFPDGTTWQGADLRVALTLRQLIANFVTYLNPTPADVEGAAVANTPTWAPYARDSERYLELVWPPAGRQWFGGQLTVARRDQFSEGGAAASSTGTSTSTGTSSRNQKADTGGAAASAPSAALAAVVLALTLALRGNGV
ncbi:Carboxylesterase 3B [Frankliniella fusca]|uniref:Carboxylic ester hydrolase n=1 Tax=Frankliniella fusca TaxID=407009 RepID=A0AAE1HS90_9NEOP|nr:Carboxylesterase 3B [Frankliniella fusca]